MRGDQLSTQLLAVREKPVEGHVFGRHRTLYSLSTDLTTCRELTYARLRLILPQPSVPRSCLDHQFLLTQNQVPVAERSFWVRELYERQAPSFSDSSIKQGTSSASHSFVSCIFYSGSRLFHFLAGG